MLHTSYMLYATLSSGIAWNVPRVICIFMVYTRALRRVCRPGKKTIDKWDIPRYHTREHCITILYHAMENTMANTINAAYTLRMMGRLDVIPSNIQRLSCIWWLYFLWDGMNACITTPMSHVCAAD